MTIGVQMIKINVSTKEIAELLKLAGDAVEGVKLEENAGSLRISKPGEFDIELGSISLNNAKVKFKGIAVSVNNVTLRDGALDIEGCVG